MIKIKRSCAPAIVGTFSFQAYWQLSILFMLHWHCCIITTLKNTEEWRCNVGVRSEMLWTLIFCVRLKTDLQRMANSMENGVKDEPKTQFMAREGTYRLMSHSDYSRQNRVGYSSTGHGNIPVRVSFVTVEDTCGPSERICFNYGRELYVYVYKGVQKVSCVLLGLNNVTM